MLVTLDIESYYDQNYTLKKLSTSEYIRDRRFEAMCVGIKIDKAKAIVYPPEEIKAALKKIDWEKATLLCHHTHFDGLILSHLFGIVPARYACTLSNSRALTPKGPRNDLNSVAERYKLGNKLQMPDFEGRHWSDLTEEERDNVADYCGVDVELCYKVYQEQLKEMPAEELDLVNITVRMFADPVLECDLPRAKKELEREIAHKKLLVSKSGVDLDTLMSNPKFAAALAKLGISPPTKVSKTTGKEAFAFAKTDEDLNILLAYPDKKVVALVKARIAVKSTIGETRAQRLIWLGSNGNKLPVYLKYCGAHTTRWSGSDGMNFQNFKRGGALRKCIKAPK